MRGELSSGGAARRRPDAPFPVVVSVEALPPGTRLAHWEVLQRMAAGGYGTVYAVRRAGRLRARRYALKLARHPDSPWFSREAEILSRLRHPGVPRLMATGTWRPGAMGYPFLVMEHVDGESLYAWSLARNPSARDVGGLLAQASEVLAFAHQRGVLHRDFKGDNVRIQPGGRLKLLDWGAGWHPEAAPLTATDQLPPGTAHYYSPQLHLLRASASSIQAAERPLYSVADELYAVGVSFYRLLTETYPVAASRADAARLEEGHAFPSLLSINPRVPEALASLVTRLLAFSPEARPPSASDLASKVRRTLAEADASWDVPLFDWAFPPSSHSRTTQEEEGAAGPVAPGQEVALQHARLQRVDLLRAMHDARELRRRAPAHVARMEARAILAAGPVRRRQALRATWHWGAGGILFVLAMVLLIWILKPQARASTVDAARPVSPPMARPAAPDQAAAPGAAPPSHAPRPLEEKAMTVPLKQDRTSHARSLARGCTLAVGAASAALVACAGTPLRPEPQRCPQAALEAMKELDLQRDNRAAMTLDIRYRWRDDAENVTVGDGDIVSVQKESMGRLPQGTLLYGRLWTGGKRVMGHYTRAETPDGHTYPVCIVLGNPGEGWWKEAGSKPGAAIVPLSVGYTVVDAFP
ncbi:serine/threonine protein kinase [Corallococcus llansteffanensis]|uniref:Serine/threonine protein kinase n=1 Tax=Corallococcus llansteffanensis TaxID=2316731 RepID=A0A3A8PF44_9BACT|nr:serine/threonine-protein kinase [Corallococcus llansteffanensis]RKH54988.1 serine/threonine protein kinase [Corallococcus llansteffanensis]